MNIRRLLRRYRRSLWIVWSVALVLSVAALWILFWRAPHRILEMMNLLSPISKALGDLFWFFIPQYEWVRTAGEWMGRAVRFGLSKADARSEILGRSYIDGFVLVTFLAWILRRVLRVLMDFAVAYWFNSKYEIVEKNKTPRSKAFPRVEPTLGGPKAQPDQKAVTQNPVERAVAAADEFRRATNANRRNE